MNKLSKILVLCLIMILMVSFVSMFTNESLGVLQTSAKATTDGGRRSGTGFNWKTSVTDFEKATGNTKANTATKNIVGAFAVIVKVAGTGVAVVMLIVLAMKYMIAAPGDKADIKKHAIVYVVGAVILFASTQIIGIIADFSTNIKA